MLKNLHNSHQTFKQRFKFYSRDLEIIRNTEYFTNLSNEILSCSTDYFRFSVSQVVFIIKSYNFGLKTPNIAIFEHFRLFWEHWKPELFTFQLFYFCKSIF